ncbi:MAG: hypothetical protein JEZ03_15455, partial [Bacteroidales bacterium]|nr:hypothetical protein [Bacteroidales bacterium]
YWRVSRKFDPSDSLNNFLGDLNKYVFRYKIKTSTGIKAAITAEKDAGEVFFTDLNPNGFDLYTGYLQFERKGVFNTFILGHYRMFFGQGLTMGQGFSRYKSVQATSNQHFGNQIRPSASTSTFGSFRGAVFQYSKARFTLSPFISYHSLDATIDTIINEYESLYFIRSIKTDDYHRTLNENKKRNTAKEIVAGAQTEYMLNSIKIGLVSFYTHYNIPIVQPSEPYNQFRFSGKENINTGFYFQTFGSKNNIYGEISSGMNLKMAWLVGINLNPDTKNAIEIIIRNYSRGFQNKYSNGFKESSNAENERGIYMGYQSLLHKNWTLNCWYDWFQFPWMTYQSDHPSNGSEFLNSLQYHPGNSFKAELLYKYQNKPYSQTTDTHTSESTTRKKQSLRFQFEYTPLSQLCFRYRVEISEYIKNLSTKSKGFLLYQDIIYRNEELPFSATLRYAFFDTEDFDNRFYTYEHDVLYAFSVPAYYKKGNRIYLNTRLNLSDFCSIWLKLAHTAYIKKRTGNGTQEDALSNKSEISAQIKFHL